MWIATVTTPIILSILGYFAVQVLNEQVQIAKTQTDIQFILQQQSKSD
jgi:hypothetical protein